MFLQIPPPTRFDLSFSIAGIPIRVHPLFWMLALLIGSSSGGLIQIVTWVVAVFVSIIVHEMGHALAMRRYGQSSRIVLHMMGGLTIPDQYTWGSGFASIALTPIQEIVISLAGPVSGFFLAGLVGASVLGVGGTIGMGTLLGFIPLPAMVALPFGGSILNSLVIDLLWVNIFWGIFNLVPVYPLDGGNVIRYFLLNADPLDGIRKSLWISVIAGVLAAMVGLLFLRSIYMAFLFGLLAFQSYQSLQGHAGRF